MHCFFVSVWVGHWGLQRDPQLQEKCRYCGASDYGRHILRAEFLTHSVERDSFLVGYFSDVT